MGTSFTSGEYNWIGGTYGTSAIDLYSKTNIGIAKHPIESVKVYACAGGTSGSANINMVVEYGGTYGYNTYAFPLPSGTYGTVCYAWDKSPITGTNWSWSDFESMTFGIKLNAANPAYCLCFQSWMEIRTLQRNEVQIICEI
jgi:hypothetical protein